MVCSINLICMVSATYFRTVIIPGKRNTVIILAKWVNVKYWTALDTVCTYVQAQHRGLSNAWSRAPLPLPSRFSCFLNSLILLIFCPLGISQRELSDNLEFPENLLFGQSTKRIFGFLGNFRKLCSLGIPQREFSGMSGISSGNFAIYDLYQFCRVIENGVPT